jgi:hypothetical protein
VSGDDHLEQNPCQIFLKNLNPLVMDELINGQQSYRQLQFEVRSRANNRIRIT